MPRKPKKQQDDEYVELPEDRLDQIDQDEPVEEGAGEKKEPKKRATPAKKEQAEGPKTKLPEKADPMDALRDDLLDDIRKELVSETEAEEEEKGKGLFGRFRKRSSKSSTPEAVETETKAEAEAEVEEQPSEEIVQPKPKKKPRTGSKEEEQAIQEFFSDLEAMADLDFDAEYTEQAEPLELETDLMASDLEAELDIEFEPEVEVEEQPEQQPEEPEEAKEVDIDEVRQIALEEYDGTAVEPEAQPHLREQVRSTVRDLRPFERVLLIAFSFLVAVSLLFFGGYAILNSGVISTPTPTPTEDLADMVYPIRLSMPGGWQFDLSRGRVVEGKWSPNGAEWLEGTIISRWVALPWSLQLEAVLRTLQQDDVITLTMLTMSNFDSLDYNVYSIQELTMEQIQARDSNTPELLVILFANEENSDVHWVVTARP